MKETLKEFCCKTYEKIYLDCYNKLACSEHLTNDKLEIAAQKRLSKIQ